jgi:hypothetical protein
VIEETLAGERAGERRYERWQAANARSDRRREKQEKMALAVLMLAAGAWLAVQVIL